MKTRSVIETGGITLGPCQICNQLKEKFYLCNRNHTTCDECKEVRNKNGLRPPVIESKASPSEKHVRFSLPLTPDSPSDSRERLSPDVEEDSVTPIKTPPNRLRSPSNDQPTIVSPRSPIKSLVTVPKTYTQRLTPEPTEETHFVPNSRKLSGRGSPPPPEDDLENLEIFCQACDDFVEATPVTLPMNMLKSLVPQSFDPADGGKDSEEVDEDVDSADTLVPMTSVELSVDEDLRKDVDSLRIGLVNAYSELMTTRCDLDEVMYATEKLEMDVDMLRGGVNYVYFNFEAVQKRKEIRIEERICGIPFVLMVRMRLVARIPHMGFFIGLEPYEGRAHSPLKKIIVFRAHNAYGKVVEKHTLETFENGQSAHPCFDLTKPQDGSLWGYANFLKKDRILKPDMLKDGRLCLSLQIKPLM